MIKCNFIRGKKIESSHLLCGAVIDSNKKIIYSCGDPDLSIPARSTLKPFQSAASLEKGSYDKFNFTKKEIALTCASHNGQKKHISVANSMLKKLKLSKNELECGKHPPHLNKNQKTYHCLHNNCSGKHIGMLSLSKALKKNNKKYIQKSHPVQKIIKTYLEHQLGKKLNEFAIDGCSAPTPYLSISEMAYLYARLVEGKNKELQIIYNAMTSNPFMIGGDKRFDTSFIKALNQRGVSKGGAEGLLSIGLKHKNRNIGVCIKTLDGSSRPRGIVAVSLLKKLGLLSKTELQSLSKYVAPPILNLNKIKTGEVKIEF